MNTPQTFWPFVDKSGDCWNWTGTLWFTGYGRYNYRDKSWKAHRLAWIFSGNQLSDSQCLLHACDNRRCCNPDHLFIGTRADNNLDKVRKGRQSKGEDYKRTRLTTEDILRIRASDIPIHDLCEEYDISWSHINNIQHRRKWKHV